MRYCAEHNFKPHPARFPAGLPEFFIRLLTDKGDLVVDPFAGSCVTGEVAEKLEREWICVDNIEEYLKGARGRFNKRNLTVNNPSEEVYYKIPRPGLMWNNNEEALPTDGGRNRPLKQKEKIQHVPLKYKDRDHNHPEVQYRLFDKGNSKYNNNRNNNDKL